MAIVRIELTAADDDEQRRRRQQRAVKAVIILAGLIVLAFAAPEPPATVEPALRLAPLVTDFGAQDVGTPSKKVITLHNAERTPFVVAGITAVGVTQGDFSVDAARCRRIEPDTDCVAVVSFNPRTAGAQTATFRLIDDANATSQTFVARGVGTESAPPAPPPVAVVVQPPPPPPQFPPPPAPVVTPPVHLLPPQPPAPPPLPAPVTITVPMPVEPPPTTTEEPPQTTTEAPPQTATEAPPATTTQAPPPKERDKTRDNLKKAGRVLGALALGAIIAHQNQGGHTDRPQQSDTKPDRRIDVTPRALAVNPRWSKVTVTNVGRDEVTITSVTTSSSLFQQTNQCGALRPGQSCQISVAMPQWTESAGTLVVNSNAGSVTVTLQPPPG